MTKVLFRLAVLAVATWVSTRILVSHRALFGAGVLAVSMIVWVLLALVALWAAIIARVGDLSTGRSPAFWFTLAVAIAVSAATWLVTRHLSKRPLAFAGGVLTACFLTLLIGVVTVRRVTHEAETTAVDAVRALEERARSELAARGEGQSDVQADYLDDRAFLHDGVVQTEKSVVVTVGEAYELEAVVCGGGSGACEDPGPAAPSGGKDRAQIKTGGRLSAWATAPDDVRISPPDAVIQPVVDDADHAAWRWYLVPSRTGEFQGHPALPDAARRHRGGPGCGPADEREGRGRGGSAPTSTQGLSGRRGRVVAQAAV